MEKNMTEEQKQLVRENAHLPVSKIAVMVGRTDTVVRRLLVKEGLTRSNKNPTYKKYKSIISQYDGETGVYMILNLENFKFYIGVADNIGTRLKEHCLAFGIGKHNNKPLQEDHDLGHNFSFEVLFLGDIYEAYDIEADLIMLSFGEQECYNQTPTRKIPKLKPKFISLFIANQKQIDNGCIEYTGELDKNGYGKCRIYSNGKEQNIGAHRISYFLHYNKDPYSLHVCHSCDNRKCVNPKHLSLGSNKDNASDRANKGRNNNRIKVNTEVLTRIIKLYLEGHNYRQIAIRCNLNRTTVSKYINEYNSTRKK